jgi:antitoxin HicB
LRREKREATSEKRAILDRRFAELELMAKRNTVSDGKLVLTLEDAEEGGFIVTSPLDPELVTEGDTVAECFEMARDALKALKALKASRAKLQL